ncbi:MAG: zinc-dependent alcohol dehydrogenase [Gaiellaceae bacterium]
MKALCWEGRNKVEVENVPDPKILNDRDAIVRITSTAICGSDLHLLDGYVPTMKKGDILGHEFMGEVVEFGKGVGNLQVGDRVVVPFPIACGACNACELELYSLCENTNPNARLAEKMFGHSTAGIFGYSHLTGGFAGGQSEYVRVPFADVGPLKIENGFADEQVLFLSDVYPTGYMGAEMCDIRGGEVIAIWGAGPVGQFAAASASLLGAERVIVIDRFEYRLRIAERHTGAETLNYEEVDSVPEALKELTGGRGPDACIDAVGMEAHGATMDDWYDKTKTSMMLATDRLSALRQAIHACRKGGTVSIPGVYGGFLDKVPFGAAFGKGLTLKMGQTHVHRYLPILMDRIERGEIDPSYVITHRLRLDDAPDAYTTFRNKEDNCIKVVLRPGRVLGDGCCVLGAGC